MGGLLYKGGWGSVSKLRLERKKTDGTQCGWNRHSHPPAGAGEIGLAFVEVNLASFEIQIARAGILVSESGLLSSSIYTAFTVTLHQKRKSALATGK